MATHKTGKCPVGKHRVFIFSPWRSAATAYRRPSPVYQSNSFHYCHSTREVCRGGLVHCRKAFPACGCICFLHSNNNVPQSLALACRILPCSGTYFRSNWIVLSFVSMGVGRGPSTANKRKLCDGSCALLASTARAP